jgi:protein ImuA
VALPPAVAAAVWRGDQLGRATAPTRSSGFAALDAQLPGGGWPCQGLTELLCPQPGTLAWRLLAPLLRALCPAGGGTRPAAATPVLLVGPPHPPHPPGLRADGIDERGLVWLQAHTAAERLWTTEQLLKARAPGVLVTWLPQARPEQLRRLQVLAGAAQGPVFVCRPQAAAREASAAPLRLLVRVGAAGADDGPWALQVDLLKRPGPPLARTLSLPSVPGGLAALLPPRLRRAGAAVPPATVPIPLPAFASPREEDHVVVRPAAARSAWH